MESGPLLWIFRCCHDLFELAQRCRKIGQKSLPDDFVVDVKIAMNKTMTHGDDGVPGDVRLSLPCGGAHLACGFADDFDGFDNGEKQLTVVVQVGSLPVGRKVQGVVGGVEHVADADQVMRMHTLLSLPAGRRREKGDSNRLGCAGPRGGQTLR